MIDGSRGRLAGRLPVRSWPIFGLTLASLIAGSASAAPALPTGGKVVAGSASIGAVKGSTLTIDQSSRAAIIDWSSFSIGAAGRVQFDNGTGATLNRVTGKSGSILEGMLSGTGSVYLLNPNGVVIGRHGVVNLGGTFVASTLDVTNSNFMAGGALTFSGGSPAAVVNYGKIGSLGGDVALIAARVENDGTMHAAHGDAGLLSGYRVLIRDKALNEGKFAILLGGAETSATNAGVIEAASAELRANGGNVYALAGNTGGVIKATGVSTTDGKVFLIAKGGTLDVAGTLQAQGKNATAGAIETSGQTVQIGRAAIDAHGGTWTVDPDDLTIDAAAATTIDTALNAGTSVLEQTTASGTAGSGTVNNTSGNGDIIVAAPITWTTTAGLTLSAYRNIDVNAQITASGGGALTLATDNSNAGNGGTLFFNGGSARFTGVSGGQPTGALTINGNAYTLVADIATLSADITTNGGAGYYALATPIDAGATTYSTDPIAYTASNFFGGVFEGLGNSIANLTINDSTDPYVGLFGKSGGTIRDVGVVQANVNGLVSQVMVGQATINQTVGALVGLSFGSLTNDFATGSVSSLAAAGGLAGINDGAVSNSSAAVTVVSTDSSGSSEVGGLVGLSFGTVNGSSATGDVSATTGTNVGGLIGGNNSGAVTNSWASGTVIGARNVGGLIGQNSGANVTYSYATGNVTGVEPVGGLIGYNSSSFTDSTETAYQTGLDHDHASGTVTAGSGNLATAGGGLVGSNYTSFISNSYATGDVVGASNTAATNNSTQATQSLTSAIGGLVGENDRGSITTSYATGAVTGGTGTVFHPLNDNPPANATDIAYDAGGLVGLNRGEIDGSTGQILDAQVTQSYATGKVTGGNAGGLIGVNTGATVQYDYAIGAVVGGDTGSTGTAGGLIGLNTGRVDIYQTQDPNNKNGIIDNNKVVPAAVSQVWADGAVSGGDTGAAGGLIGTNAKDGSLAQAYWDEGATGQATAVGGGAGTVDGATVGPVGGASGNDPYAQSSYGTFNFGTEWFSADGLTRPFLRSENSSVIVNAHQLELVGANLSGTYALGANIDMAPELATSMWRTSANPYAGSNSQLVGAHGFAPIGGGFFNRFTGTLDGAGFTISNLNVVEPAAQYLGLFSYIGNHTGGGGMVENLTLSNVNISGKDTVGGLSGYNDGTILSVGSSGAVSETGDQGTVGGLVGSNSEGTITDSSASGTVTGSGKFDLIGGLVGSNGGTQNGAGGTIDKSFVTAITVTASSATVGSNIGGLAGVNENIVSNSTAAGTVGGSGAGSAGGLVGFVGFLANSDTGAESVTNSSSSMNVTGADGASAGGLVGTNAGKVTGSHATGSASVNGTYVAGSIGGNVGGLVGTNSGTVSGSYATGAVTDTGDGGPWGGGLVGFLNGGSIDTSWASGSVTVSGAGGAGAGGATSGSQPAGGGLVGAVYPNSTIKTSFATGPVSVTGVNGEAGGLVGYNDAAITDSYAMAPVTGGSGAYAGGLVGYNDTAGTIASTYATGLVGNPSGAATGGLVASNNNATAGAVTDSYWDVGTTGQTTDGAQTSTVGTTFGFDPTSGSIGATTAQLQGALPTGFSNATWSILAGESYPYLSWQFASGTPQVVSGFAYGAGAKTSLAGAAVAAWSKGATLASTLTGGGVTSGANGYYYYLLAPGTLPASTLSQVGITVTPAGGPSVTGLSFSGGFSAADGSVLGLNATTGLVYARTAETTDSALIFDLASAFGAANYASLSAALTGSNLQVQSLGDFAIDKAVNIGAATANLDVGGVLTESGSGAVTAFRLNGSAVGGVALTASGNKIAHVNSFTNTGAGGFSLTDGENLVTGAIGAGTGDLTLTTTGSGSGLFVNGQLSAGGTIALNSSGAITENAFGALLASSLTGSSVGGASMTQSANQFATLTSFTNTGAGAVNIADGSGLSVGALTDTGGNVTINDTGALAITGLVNAGVHVLKLVATGSVTESGSGAIDAGYLAGSGAGGVALAGANLVGRLAGFTNTGAGGFSLKDGETLAVTGAVNSGTGDLALTTTGAGHGLYVSAPLTAGATLALTSSGKMIENGSGAILATTFTGASVGGANLALAANQFGSLSTFTDTGGGNVSINDGSSLSITGLVSIGSGQLTLTDTGSVSETGAGAIDVGHLAGGAATGATLNGANLVSHLNGFTVSGTGDLSLTDGQALDVVAPVNLANGTLSLTTTAGNIAFQGSVSAKIINLVSAAQALEFSTGAITTGLLNVSAQTGILLTSNNNSITAVGTDSTTTGPNKINK